MMLFTSDNAANPLKHATNNNGVRIKTDFCQGQSRYQLPTFDYYDFERHGTADKNCPVHWYSFIDIQPYFDFERHSNYDFERQPHCLAIHWYSSSPFSRYSLPFDDSTWSATLYDFERQVGSHRHQHCIADKHCTADTGLSPSSHWYSLIYFRRYSSSSVKAENSKFLTTRSISQFWSVS